MSLNNYRFGKLGPPPKRYSPEWENRLRLYLEELGGRMQAQNGGSISVQGFAEEGAGTELDPFIIYIEETYDQISRYVDSGSLPATIVGDARYTNFPYGLTVWWYNPDSDWDLYFGISWIAVKTRDEITIGPYKIQPPNYYTGVGGGFPAYIDWTTVYEQVDNGNPTWITLATSGVEDWWSVTPGGLLGQMDVYPAQVAENYALVFRDQGIVNGTGAEGIFRAFPTAVVTLGSLVGTPPIEIAGDGVTISIDGLTTVGTAGQIPASTGSAWQYLTTSGGLEVSGTALRIADLGVATGKLAAGAVTFAKLQNISTDTLVGRDAASSGDATEISVTGGIEFTTGNAIRVNATNIATGVLPRTYGGTGLDGTATGPGVLYQGAGTVFAVGTAQAIYGGTGWASYTAGDILAAQSSTALVKVPGNTTTTRKFAVSQGNGVDASVPTWDTLDAGDLPAHNHTLVDVTDVTASAAEVNILTGATVTTAELNVLDGIPATLTATELGYVDGVASALQPQLDGKQPLDTQLTQIAALGTSANEMLYTTSANTWGVTTLSSFARTILDDVTDSAVRSTINAAASTHTHAASDITSGTFDAARYANGTITFAKLQNMVEDAILGRASGAGTGEPTVIAVGAGLTTGAGDLAVTIGTEVQAYDATLTSIAALGTAADRMAYTTGIDTWAEAAITSAGRALLDDADATAQLVTLGLTATAAELNLLDLSGLTSGHVLRATGASSAAFGALVGTDLPWTGTANYVGYWSGTNTLTGDIDLQFDGTHFGLGTAPTSGVRMHVKNTAEGAVCERQECAFNATATNFQRDERHDDLLTTTASAATIVDLATTSNRVYYIEVVAQGWQTSGGTGSAGDTQVMKVRVRVKNVAGTLTIGTPVVTFGPDGDFTTAVMSWTNPSGTTLRQRIAGVTNRNISWHFWTTIWEAGA